MKKNVNEKTTVQTTTETANNGLATNLTNDMIVQPVKWRYEKKDLGNGEYLLQFIATMDKGWYIYSQNIAEGGPIPTSFTFVESPDVTLLGKDKLEEVSAHKKQGFDKIFKMNVTKFAEEVTFEKRVKLANPDAPITGSLEYMTCDDLLCCLPPTTEEFGFNVQQDQGTTAVASGDENLPSYMQQLVAFSLRHQYSGRKKKH